MAAVIVAVPFVSTSVAGASLRLAAFQIFAKLGGKTLFSL
jgi:hypothetical protein